MPEGGTILPQIIRPEGDEFRSHPDLGKGQFLAQFRPEAHLFPAVKGEFSVGVKEDIAAAFGSVFGGDPGVLDEEAAPAVLPTDDRRDRPGYLCFLAGELPPGVQQIRPLIPGEQQRRGRRQQEQCGKIGPREPGPLPAEERCPSAGQPQHSRQDGKQPDPPQG